MPPSVTLPSVAAPLNDGECGWDMPITDRHRRHSSTSSDGWFTEATASQNSTAPLWRHATSQITAVQHGVGDDRVRRVAEWAVAHADNGVDGEAAAEQQWEQLWGLKEKYEWHDQHATQRRWVDEPPAEEDEQPLPLPPPRDSSSHSRLLQWSDEGSAVCFDPASFSLATHPRTFHALLSAAHSHPFLPLPSSASSVSAFSSPIHRSAVLVRCCVLVLQSIPSSLFALSSDKSQFVIDSTAATCPLSPSLRHLLTDFAHIGTRLHSTEQSAACLSANSSDVIGVAFGAALRSFCLHHKLQVDRISRQGEVSASSHGACTVIRLHVAAQPLVQQITWLHCLLLSSAHPSVTSATPSSSSSTLPSIPGGVDLLSYLYHCAHSLSIDSPFHATLTFLLSSALVPYLRLLSSYISGPSIQSAHSSSVQSTLPLPSFLLSELERVNSAAEMLHLTDRAGGSQWTAFGRQDNDSNSCLLSVGWTARDTASLHCALVQRARLQQTQLEAALAQVDTEWKQQVQRATNQKRLTTRAVRQHSIQQRHKDDAAEKSAEGQRRSEQDEYREQLRQQVNDKKRRQIEEKEEERAESERVKQQVQRHRAIIDEEKEKLITRIQAVRQGRSEIEVRRTEWQNKRSLRAEQLKALLEEDRSSQQQQAESNVTHPQQTTAAISTSPSIHTATDITSTTTTISTSTTATTAGGARSHNGQC